MRIALAAILATSVVCGASSQAADLPEPLWEAGVGGGAFSGPTYPGADDNTTQALFIPYVIYSGEVFSIGEESGVRAVAFANEKFECDISLGASLAADASEDDDRDGMPDLEFLFEIGPQIIYHAAQYEHKSWTSHFDIKLRTRAIIATDLGSFEDQGYIVEPALVYELKSKRNRHLEIQLDIEMINGSERLNEYFYDGDRRYAKEGHEEYKAKEGYIGTEVGLSLSIPVNPQLRLFGGFDVEFYDGHANRASPLFKDVMRYSGGLGLVYTFCESE